MVQYLTFAINYDVNVCFSLFSFCACMLATLVCAWSHLEQAHYKYKYYYYYI
jgi:hypothetical protein